jgi:hypothetical protein
MCKKYNKGWCICYWILKEEEHTLGKTIQIILYSQVDKEKNENPSSNKTR